MKASSPLTVAWAASASAYRFTDVPFSSIKMMEPLRLEASCICSLKFSQDGSEGVGINLDITDLGQ